MVNWLRQRCSLLANSVRFCVPNPICTIMKEVQVCSYTQTCSAPEIVPIVHLKLYPFVRIQMNMPNFSDLLNVKKNKPILTYIDEPV